jgi:hypothetical protein
MRLGRPALALLTVLLLSSAVLAQAPKAGDWYEDNVDVGFKIKGPKGWGFIPPQPGQTHMIGKFDAGKSKRILASDRSQTTYWNYYAWMMKFDRRSLGSGDKNKSRAPKNLAEWFEKRGPGNSGNSWKEDEKARKEGKVGKIAVTEYEFEDRMGEDTPIRIYAMVYHLADDIEVAIAFNGPGDKKKWSKHKSACRKLAKTFKPVEVELLETDAGAGTLRDIKRQQLQQEIAKAADWKLYETPNYFIVSNNPDKDFIDELKERVEAIRKVYGELYPPSLAERLRKLAGEESGDDEEEPGERTVVSTEDPMEVSKTSVIRVCKTREQYNSYGGPPSTGGYWSSYHKELVVFDDKQVLGRASTWGTLNHEAFHQYIYYFFGNLAPHSWYNEGHGDFFGGYEYKHKKFNLTRYEKRIRTIQQVVRDRKHVPLKDLVSFSQREYYGQNSFSALIGDNYAQGWSLIYFLRTGKKSARCWDASWDTILDTYLEVLVKTSDHETAIDKAFQDIDWEKLETCWMDYTAK